MKPTTEQRALAACQAYAHHNQEIRRLTKLIAKALELCKGANGTRRLEFHGTSDEFGNGDTWTEIINRDTDPTHLKEHWRTESDFRLAHAIGEAPGSFRPTLDELKEECPHCRRAYDLVEQRKAERKLLGKAKRAITMAGRAKA